MILAFVAILRHFLCDRRAGNTAGLLDSGGACEPCPPGAVCA